MSTTSGRRELSGITPILTSLHFADFCLAQNEEPFGVRIAISHNLDQDPEVGNFGVGCWPIRVTDFRDFISMRRVSERRSSGVKIWIETDADPLREFTKAPRNDRSGLSSHVHRARSRLKWKSPENVSGSQCA